MAPKRDRRRASAAPEGGWPLAWYNQLPEGPCKLAVNLFRDERRRAGASDQEALMESFAYAQQHFPEEVVLWTLTGGVVPDPWHNASVQLGIQSSLLALRQLREERALAEEAAAAALAAVPAQPDAVTPFAGAAHRLGD